MRTPPAFSATLRRNLKDNLSDLNGRLARLAKFRKDQNLSYPNRVRLVMALLIIRGMAGRLAIKLDNVLDPATARQALAVKLKSFRTGKPTFDTATRLGRPGWISLSDVAEILNRDMATVRRMLDPRSEEVAILTEGQHKGGRTYTFVSPDYILILAPEIREGYGNTGDLAEAAAVDQDHYNALRHLIQAGDPDLLPDLPAIPGDLNHLYKKEKGAFSPALLRAIRMKFSSDRRPLISLTEMARRIGVTDTTLGLAVWAYVHDRIAVSMKNAANEFGIPVKILKLNQNIYKD